MLQIWGEGGGGGLRRFFRGMAWQGDWMGMQEGEEGVWSWPWFLSEAEGDPGVTAQQEDAWFP